MAVSVGRATAEVIFVPALPPPENVTPIFVLAVVSPSIRMRHLPNERIICLHCPQWEGKVVAKAACLRRNILWRPVRTATFGLATIKRLIFIFSAESVRIIYILWWVAFYRAFLDPRLGRIYWRVSEPKRFHYWVLWRGPHWISFFPLHTWIIIPELLCRLYLKMRQTVVERCTTSSIPRFCLIWMRISWWMRCEEEVEPSLSIIPPVPTATPASCK